MKARKRDLVLIVRHGIAEDDHPAGDAARGLTAAGRLRFRDHAAAVATKVRVSGIATSPLVRAVQTAEILAAACGVKDVVVRDALLPDAETESLLELINDLGPGWAFVGHNPSLAHVATVVAGQVLAMKKGAVLAIRRHKGSWVGRWLWEPARPKRLKL